MGDPKLRACGHLIDDRPVTVEHSSDRPCPLHTAMQHIRELEATAEVSPFKLRAAEKLADEVDVLVRRRAIDSRSPAADALLDYRNPPSSERSTRITELEAEVSRLANAYQRTCDGMGYQPAEAQGDLTPPEWAHQLRHRAEDLEADVAAKDAELARARSQMGERTAMRVETLEQEALKENAELREKLAEAQREAREAKQDSERLDWLEKQPNAPIFRGFTERACSERTWSVYVRNTKPSGLGEWCLSESLREAIDEARAREADEEPSDG